MKSSNYWLLVGLFSITSCESESEKSQQVIHLETSCNNEKDCMVSRDAVCKKESKEIFRSSMPNPSGQGGNRLTIVWECSK